MGVLFVLLARGCLLRKGLCVWELRRVVMGQMSAITAIYCQRVLEPFVDGSRKAGSDVSTEQGCVIEGHVPAQPWL